MWKQCVEHIFRLFGRNHGKILHLLLLQVTFPEQQTEDSCWTRSKSVGRLKVIKLDCHWLEFCACAPFKNMALTYRSCTTDSSVARARLASALCRSGTWVKKNIHVLWLTSQMAQRLREQDLFIKGLLNEKGYWQRTSLLRFHQLYQQTPSKKRKKTRRSE